MANPDILVGQRCRRCGEHTEVEIHQITVPSPSSQERIAALETELAAVKEQRNALRAELQQSKGQLQRGRLGELRRELAAVKAERDELENNLDSCASECLGLRQTLKDDSSFWRNETARANKIVKHCEDALKECLRQLVCCHQDVEIVHAEWVTRDALLKIEEYYKS